MHTRDTVLKRCLPVKSFIRHRACAEGAQQPIRCSGGGITHGLFKCLLNGSQLPPRALVWVPRSSQLYSPDKLKSPESWAQKNHANSSTQAVASGNRTPFLPYRRSSADCAALLPRSGSCFSTVESSRQERGGKKPISPRIDKLSDHTENLADSNSSLLRLKAVCWIVVLLCDTRVFSANDASRVKTGSAGAPAVRANGLFIHPAVTLRADYSPE